MGRLTPTTNLVQWATQFAPELRASRQSQPQDLNLYLPLLTAGMLHYTMLALPPPQYRRGGPLSQPVPVMCMGLSCTCPMRRRLTSGLIGVAPPFMQLGKRRPAFILQAAPTSYRPCAEMLCGGKARAPVTCDLGSGEGGIRTPVPVATRSRLPRYANLPMCPGEGFLSGFCNERPPGLFDWCRSGPTG